MERARKAKAARIAVAAGAVVCMIGFAVFVAASHAQSGPRQRDMAVGKATRSEVIEGVIANLDRSYVFPEQAAALGRQLRAQLQRGDFDSVTSAEKFAEALTEALQRETHDKHLGVEYFEKAVPDQVSGQEDSAEDQAAELIHSQRFNFGIESVGRLRGNMGYLDLHQFDRPQRVAERIASAMTLLGDTSGLIIDLRHCDGGDPDTVMLFASYLFDQRTHLNDVYWRDENRTEERWTTDSVAGKKYGGSRRVYLLTSSDTFSGCEDFAYALKNAHRATLVGETTGGGAHAGNPHRLNAHFMIFVPSGRPINPVTHTDWEGVGVVPDVKASAKNALDVAQVALLKELVAGETDAVWKEKLQRRIADLN